MLSKIDRESHGGELSAEGTFETGSRWTRLATVACALGLCIVARDAHAVSDVNVYIEGCPSLQSCNDPTLTFQGGLGSGDGGGGPLDISDIRMDVAHGSTVQATAIANQGTLRVYVYASRPTTGPIVVGPDITAPDQAHAQAKADFSDELTIMGAPGNIGLVDVDFTTVLSGVMTPSPPPLYAGNQAILRLCIDSVFGGCTWALSNESYIPSHATQTLTLKGVAAGSVLYLYGELTADATAETDFNVGAFTLNYLDTGAVYARATTPGSSLVARSGHDYAQTVPEPGTDLLQIAAVLCLAALPKACKRHP
jgi:hypothetical protein